MRNCPFIENRFYLLSGSGFEKNIFLDDEDYVRFIFLITHFQSPIKTYNSYWYTKSFLKKKEFRMSNLKVDEIFKNRYIELVCFYLEPKSFSLIIKNLKKSVPSVYMQRILTAYSKYFNAKYNKKGHLLEKPFNASLISTKTELLETSKNIFNNLSKVPNKNHDEYWSSFYDYTTKNRWGKLLVTSHILEHFKSPADYEKYVKNSSKTRS